MRAANIAQSEVRVIGPRCGGTDHHSIMVATHDMGHTPRLRARDPAAFATGRCDAAIKRCCQFQMHQGPAACHTHEKPCMGLRSFGRSNIGRHRYTRVTQPRDALPRGAWVGIILGDDHTGHPRLDQGHAARRGLAVMIARLKRNIGSRPPRALPRLSQGLRFSMWPARRCGHAPPDYQAIFNNQTANSRVWPSATLPALSECQRGPHEA